MCIDGEGASRTRSRPAVPVAPPSHLGPHTHWHLHAHTHTHTLAHDSMIIVFPSSLPHSIRRVSPPPVFVCCATGLSFGPLMAWLRLDRVDCSIASTASPLRRHRLHFVSLRLPVPVRWVRNGWAHTNIKHFIHCLRLAPCQWVQLAAPCTCTHTL